MHLLKPARIAVLAALLVVPIAFAQNADRPSDKPFDKPDHAAPAREMAAPQPDSVTDGSVTVEGKPIAYRAVAGTLTVGSSDVQDATLALDGKYLPGYGEDLPAKPDEQPATARMFYVAYFMKDAPKKSPHHVPLQRRPRQPDHVSAHGRFRSGACGHA